MRYVLLCYAALESMQPTSSAGGAAESQQHLNAAAIRLTALVQQIETAQKARLTREETGELTGANVDACIAALNRAMDTRVAGADPK